MSSPSAAQSPWSWIIPPYLFPFLLLSTLVTGCHRQPATPPAPDPAVIQGMNRGVSLMGQYQYDAAAQAFQAVLQRSPDLNEAKINLAIALFNRGRKEDRDLDRSSELLQAVLRQDTNNVRALYFQGIIWQHLGTNEAAVDYFQKVAAQRPDDGAVWYLLGLSKQRIGQPSEAELLRAVQCRPYLASAYYKLSQVARLAGDTAKATQYLEIFTRVRESPLSETIELPQYNQMGDLALVQPLTARALPPLTPASLQARPPAVLAQWPARPAPAGTATPGTEGLSAGDLNQDGWPDLLLPAIDGMTSLQLLLSSGTNQWRDALAGSGLESFTNATQFALGDYDNDENTDVLLAGPDGLALLQGLGNGRFTNATAAAGLKAASGQRLHALFLDADHDGDLDIYVCHAGPLNGTGTGTNQYWNNNGNGTFTDIAAQSGLSCAGSRSVMALPGDLDGDRDMDLVVLVEQGPARVFLNNLLGQFREVTPPETNPPLAGDLGGVLQDFNGDGVLDLVVLGGNPRQLRLAVGDGQGRFKISESFLESARAAASWGPLTALRALDSDLDGDLDLAFFAERQGHLLVNDGQGRFVLLNGIWKSLDGPGFAAVEMFDLTGDLLPDLLALESSGGSQLKLYPHELTPPGTALALAPTGVRSRDKRTRSPASGFGVAVTVRAGLREHRQLYQGLSGSAYQSTVPLLAGLGGVGRADYVHLAWPDGVAQAENALAAGQVHKVAEVQRKISSCPVLFAWNGRRFEFITDFAGVGGLGYFVAPGVAAPPQVLEHVKLEPGQLVPRDGRYELRVTEPMEEVAYVDRLELWAIDHATNQIVYPDERLAINGPAPTHQWLVVDHPIFPVRATDPQGRDCTPAVLRVDRTYAYEPALDRRYCGFGERHTLELDFGSQLAHLRAEDKVFLFLNGFIEYPYSQTVYAAAQSRIGWEPIRIERRLENGQWETIVPDGGAPGGMGRTITIELSGKVGGPACVLRLTTNLELYYDQVFIGRDAGLANVHRQVVPLASAELRRVGFAREYSPDGRLPLIYDYDLTDASAPFHIPRGAYTRYGPVADLLRAYDDQFVLVGPGDEIALQFKADAVKEPAPGQTRSFILVSHAYCKDMDLYTATPETVEPLPFRGMSKYPYPPAERYPDSEQHQRYRATYNTRHVK